MQKPKLKMTEQNFKIHREVIPKFFIFHFDF